MYPIHARTTASDLRSDGQERDRGKCVCFGTGSLAPRGRATGFLAQGVMLANGLLAQPRLVVRGPLDCRVQERKCERAGSVVRPVVDPAEEGPFRGDYAKPDPVRRGQCLARADRRSTTSAAPYLRNPPSSHRECRSRLAAHHWRTLTRIDGSRTKCGPALSTETKRTA
ncbi:hypothetical protein HPB50_003823 [Hyalomma asiaticum]|uniref:Uncharacterized protein n=1 Tax=Hyalomma asiaticum TaxID=266040 RepID=A0ACB7TBU1_HYAAI|nr:hypothetical protein HPB50_003823 [Hyalomma asiaticum]